MRQVGADVEQVSRRAALAAAGAAGLALMGGALAGCGPAKAAAKPVRAAANPYVLRIRPGFIQEATPALMKQTFQPWLAQNPGVTIELMASLGRQEATAVAILAGEGPDVFSDWVLPVFLSGNLLLDLTRYVQQDNVDLGIYPRLQLEFFQQGGGLWGLPSYLHLTAPAVNLEVLDTLGLTYPEPGWTWQDWGQLWRSAAAVNAIPSKARLGYHFSWDGYDYYGNNPHPHYLKGFGGEYVDPTDSSKCGLGQAGSVSCLEWIYGLNSEKVTAPSGGSLAAGTLVCDNFATNVVVQQVPAWASLKWELYDEPAWPQGRVAYATSDFFAISATSQRPDIAWEFFRYLAVEPDWQRQMMRLIGMGPNQKALWQEWVSVLQAEAPPIRGKDLDVFVRQVESDEPYFGLTFAYQDGLAAAAINAATSPAQTGTSSVTVAAQQAVTTVDGIEAAGAALAGRMTANAKAFPTQGPAVAAVPPGV